MLTSASHRNGQLAVAKACLAPINDGGSPELTFEVAYTFEVPMIARMAGMPASALESLGSARCLEALADLEELERELSEARSRLIDVLFTGMPSFPLHLRQFMLAVKRDCFNSRPLLERREQPGWSNLMQLEGGLTSHIVTLEQRLANARRDFAKVYAGERSRERHHLMEQASDQALRRGMALASSQLCEALQRRKDLPLDPSSRKDRKLEQSLLRFLTRATAKTSPYSTLTSIALASMKFDLDPGEIVFTQAPHREISLLRIQRRALDLCRETLFRHPPVRARCLVAINDTLEEIGPEQFRMIRPIHWHVEPEQGKIVLVEAAKVEASIAGPLVSDLRRILAPGPMLYAELLRELTDGVPESDDQICQRLHETLDRFFGIGFLLLLPPWPSYEPHLEQRLLEFLQEIPPTEASAMEPVIDSLSAIRALQDRYSKSLDPVSTLAKIRSHFYELMDRVLRLVAFLPEETSGRNYAFTCYEDVLKVTDYPAAQQHEVMCLPAATVTEIMRHANALYHYTHLFSFRHDFVHSLAAFWRDHRPSQKIWGVLDLFRDIQPLWKEYLRFDSEHRHCLFGTFNPYALEAVEDLERLRKEIVEATQDLLKRGSDGLELDLNLFESLLGRIPTRYSPMLGPCVFVQPVDCGGERWVLNRLFEGTGRYGSRFTAVMDEQIRARYNASIAPGSFIDANSERLELLDLMFSNGTTSNLRWPSTRAVLQIPGEHIPEVSRRVLLKDLSIITDLDTEGFRLVDSRGRRYLPVHMSHLSNAFMPSLLRFLSVFGPFEVRQLTPRPHPRRQGDAEVFDRVTMGPLVLWRQRWVLSSLELREIIAQNSEADAFVSIHRWREATGLPQQIFFYERDQVGEGKGRVQHKPQYIDFASPSLVALFQSMINELDEPLILEEALPALPDYPLDQKLKRRALEVQIDDIALRAMKHHRTFSERSKNFELRRPSIECLMPSSLIVGEEDRT